MDFHSTVVVNEAHLPEPVHKEIDAGARRANHLSQHLLTHFRNNLVLPSLFPELHQEEQDSRQSFFA